MYSITTLSSTSEDTFIEQHQSSDLPIDAEPTINSARLFGLHDPWHPSSTIFGRIISMIRWGDDPGNVHQCSRLSLDLTQNLHPRSIAQ
jgi:hypothetical protein